MLIPTDGNHSTAKDGCLGLETNQEKVGGKPMISKQYMTWSKAAFVLVLVLGVFGAGALPPGYAQAAPQSPNATATLYPGGSVTSGYLETLWGGTGSARVLAPQTFLFGNGIPAPNLNPLNNSNSWRSLAPAGGSVQLGVLQSR